MRFSVAFLFALVLSTAAAADPLPPLGPGQNFVVFPPGTCTGLVEIGTYKPEINQYWTKNPRVFVETCSVIAMDTWPARYRLAVRCVDRETKTQASPWTRSDSRLGQPWPAECNQWTPAPPQLGTPPQ